MLAENRKAERAEKLKRRSESSKTPNRFYLATSRSQWNQCAANSISFSSLGLDGRHNVACAPRIPQLITPGWCSKKALLPDCLPTQLEILANLTRNPSSFRDVTIVRIHGLVRNNFNASLQNFHRIDATPEGQVSSRAGRSHQRRHSQHYTSMGPNSHNAPPLRNPLLVGGLEQQRSRVASPTL